MISLLSAGDRDVLRDATQQSAVFWDRAAKGRLIVSGAVALTVLLAISVLLMVAGQGMGFEWAAPERVAVVFSVLMVSWLLYNGWMISKFMPGRNDRVVIGLRNLVRHDIDPLDEKVRALSEADLKAKTTEFRERLGKGESIDDIRAEAYAVVREASRRARNHRQFECQLIGGKIIEDGRVAEMRTGEGKTIVCYMANYMKVLQGLKVHMVTVNDYLVRRDAAFCKAIFDLLDVSVGFISASMGTFGEEALERKAAYSCDITYGTNSEFGFDYLRDNMKTRAVDQSQGRLDFAVVDEVDSILIDEARTPLIISGPARDDVRNYSVADGIARSLIRKQEQANRETLSKLDQIERDAPSQLRSDARFQDGIRKFRKDALWLDQEEAEAIGHMQYFVVELDRRAAHMTEHGAKAAQQELGIGTFYDARNMNWPHYIDNSLRAHLCYSRDKEYVIQDDTIVIVDEFTGRLMQGRQWSDGLHQAVEAKERVTVKQETQTLATITLQNFFKMYRQLAGMTGTALTESDEFMKIYKLEVIAIPTNKPVRRIDYNDKLYKSVANKFDAIVAEINAYCKTGYPADPWSLYDELQQARKLLPTSSRAQKESPQAIAAQVEEISNAISLWDDAVAAPRKTETDIAAADEKAKQAHAALEGCYVKLMNERIAGRPVLVGTVSVENSQKLSDALTRRFGIEHEVLNAKNHAREAEIVAKAGQQHEGIVNKKKTMCGNVTIATNMAGRGTDIVLGPGVADIGGLHVVGTERHESRRIDNQLRGRCGRQGDPGSSRFFLSFEDDLIKLFMGDWMLRMLNRFALEEGVPIEHKSLSKGIERAQKKVEERNFGIRKNLLEYDEVPDQQRRRFYEMRQRVLIGRDLSDFIWEMIDQTVADAVERYYDPKFPALCVAEWVAQKLGIAIEAEKLDTNEKQLVYEQVREMAGAEARSNVQRTFGEYVDPDVSADDWDVRGLCNWVAQYGMNLTQRQVREIEPFDLQEQIIVAAVKKVEAEDLSAIDEFLAKGYGKHRLLRWAHEKFGIDLPPESLKNTQIEDAERMISEKMRQAYRQREVEYPVAAAVSFAMERHGSNRNAVCEQIAKWVNLKYRLGWTYDKFAGKQPQEIYAELVALNEEFMRKNRFDAEVDQALGQHSGQALQDWAKGRFGAVLEAYPLDLEGDLREQMRRCGYEMFRYELTQLERMVLLSAFDSIWKDHMYAMDLLRHGIGLRGMAERDPKIEFKREGTRLFNEMLSSIRERVTDLIFKVQFSAGAPEQGAAEPEPQAPPQRIQATHADATNIGFASAGAAAGNGAPQGGQTPQGAATPQTFRRELPKVGRNEPCPCGSGKKYKQCHGKN